MDDGRRLLRASAGDRRRPIRSADRPLTGAEDRPMDRPRRRVDCRPARRFLLPPTGVDAGSMLDRVAISIAPGTRSAGVVLRADESLDHYYEVRLEPARRGSSSTAGRGLATSRSPSSGRCPKAATGRTVSGSSSMAVASSRTWTIGWLSAAAHMAFPTGVGLFVSEGSAVFTDIAVRGLA